MGLVQQVKAALLDGQYGHPRGMIGRLLGEQMVRQHMPETNWTLELLKLQAADQVLELGFGAGKAIELAAARVSQGHVAGLDHSQAMRRSASRRNARAIKAGRVTLRQGDITKLPFAENTFDKVFSIQTFYFWSEPSLVLAEIFRILRRGGMLVVTLSTGVNGTTAGSELEAYQRLLEEEIAPAMRQLGFTAVSIAQGPHSRQFKTTALMGIK
jgi:ubiquinone/menaquinone biosynthesis C-methylase UbiE